jgi:hypothetical protein
MASAADRQEPERQERQQYLGVVVGIAERPRQARDIGLAAVEGALDLAEAAIGPEPAARQLLVDRDERQTSAGREHSPDRQPQRRHAVNRVDNQDIEHHPLERERAQPVDRDVLVRRERGRQQLDHQEQQHQRGPASQYERPATQVAVGDRHQQHEREQGAGGERHAVAVD